MSDPRREKIAFLFLEPVVSVVVALILYFPLAKPDLAELTVIFGGLLIVANIAQTLRLRREFDALTRLSEVMDLAQETTVTRVRDLLHLYVSINERELRPLKEDALGNCVTVLNKLAYDKVSGRISGGEYYIWLKSMLSGASKTSSIRAVATMEEALWTAFPAQKRYLDANIQAVRQGATFERVFITTRDRFGNANCREAIKQHSVDGIGPDNYVVWREDLEEQDQGLLQEIGLGFILFDSRVALIDHSIPPAEMTGTVTMNASQIKSLHRIFARLMQHAQPKSLADEELAELGGMSKPS